MNDGPETFFIMGIRRGLGLQDKSFTDLDFEALHTIADADGLRKLDKIFQEHRIDRIEWNNKMVEALRVEFEDEINTYKDDKERRKQYGFKQLPPHEVWEPYISELLEGSDEVVSAIVQNWINQYWAGLARKSAVKAMATGCLLPTLTFVVLISLPIFSLF